MNAKIMSAKGIFNEYLEGGTANEIDVVHAIDAMTARITELEAALERIATADHPDSKVCETNMTEHDFTEKLMNIARTALKGKT